MKTTKGSKTKDTQKHDRYVPLEKLLEEVSEHNEDSNDSSDNTNVNETGSDEGCRGGGGGGGGGKKPPASPGSDENDDDFWDSFEAGPVSYAATATGFILFIANSASTTSGMGNFLLKHTSNIFYIFLLVGIILFLIKTVALIPEKPTWLDHHELSKSIKPNKYLVTVVVIAQHILDYINHKDVFSKEFFIPNLLYAGLVATVLLMAYEILYFMYTPIKPSNKKEVSDTSDPVIRYILTMIAVTGMGLFVLIILYNLLYVLTGAPPFWYESVLPWHWEFSGYR